MKKTPGNIILQQCTINDNHMMYGSWDKMSFWTIFCCFTPLTTQEIKILKNGKKHLEISSFYTSVPKIMIICCTVPEIWRVADVIVIFHFVPYFALLPPNSLKNRNLNEMKKIPEDIIILHKCTINDMMYDFWDMTDRIFCHFGSFFAMLPHWQPKKLKFWENDENAWRYHHFTQVYQRLWPYAKLFLRHDTWRM